MTALLEHIKHRLAHTPLKIILKASITMAILYLILKSIDQKQTLDIVKGANIKLMLLAVLAQFFSTAIAAYRWQLIMQNLNFGLDFGFYWRSYFKGMFFNQALPTSIGGDAIKIIDLARKQFRKRDAFYGVTIDRIIGLAALLALSLGAYLIQSNVLPQKVYLAIVMLNVAGIAGFLCLRYLYKLPFLKHYPSLFEFLYSVAERLQLTFSAHRLLLLVSSLLIPFLAVLGFYLTGCALGLSFGLLTYFLIIPPAIVFTVIPISIAGWGVREGALVALFSLIGANKSIVLMMSVAYGFTLIIVSIPGLITFLRGRQHDKHTTHHT